MNNFAIAERKIVGLRKGSKSIQHPTMSLQNTDDTEPLLRENPRRYTTFPIQWPEIWASYKTQFACFWKAEDIKFGQDLNDWKNNLDDKEKHFIKFVLAFFAASDGIVNENLLVNFAQEVQSTEAQYFYGFQQMMENVHSESYSLMLNTYIEDETERDHLFRAIETIPVVKKKADWALKWIGSTSNDYTKNTLVQETIAHLRRLGDAASLSLAEQLDYKKPAFAQRLLAFAAVEGIMFSGSFAAIFWLKSRNLMKGLTESNEYIARDEGLHVNFAVQLYTLLENKLSDKQVHAIFKEAVDLEKEFICDALPWNLERMNARLMSQYIEYVADYHLKNLGHSPLYGSTNPFGFMELISMPTKTNFFEGENTQYQLSKGGDINLEVDF